MNETVTIQQLINTLTKVGEKIGSFDVPVYYYDSEITGACLEFVYDMNETTEVHVSLQ